MTNYSGSSIENFFAECEIVAEGGAGRETRNVCNTCSLSETWGSKWWIGDNGGDAATTAAFYNRVDQQSKQQGGIGSTMIKSGYPAATVLQY